MPYVMQQTERTEKDDKQLSCSLENPPACQNLQEDQKASAFEDCVGHDSGVRVATLRI